MTDDCSLPWQRGSTADGLPPTVVELAPSFEGRDVLAPFPERWTLRPADEVAGSWLRQVTVVNVDGLQVRLQARLAESALGAVVGDQFASRPEIAWPLDGPLLIIGSVAGPSVTFSDEAAGIRDDLALRLAVIGSAQPAWSVDRDHRWTEPSVIAYPPPGAPIAPWLEHALDAARELGIRHAVLVADGLWTALSLGATDGYHATASAPASITRDVERRCPMQAAPAAGEYCRMRGGPWTSASIAAAAGWREHRDRLVEAIGCDTCEGNRMLLQGQVFQGGGPISLVRSAVPTRWLGVQEGPRAQPID